MQIDRCRVCLRCELIPILDLGSTALANRFLWPGQLDEPEPLYPLRLVLCPHCGLVQIDEEVPPEILFGHYLYVSGTSELIHHHARFLADHFTRSCSLGGRHLVVEAASNDGTVLRAFRGAGTRVLGIEPARNIADIARQSGIETLDTFFDASQGRLVRERHGPANLFLARHVLAHVADLHGFVEGIAQILARDGLAAIEMPHLIPFHDQLEYDTIYHEHLCYFSVRVLANLFGRFGLEIVDVQELAIHGGSILVSVQHRTGPRQPSPAVGRMLEREERAGLHRLEPWLRFSRRVEDSRARLLQTLADLRQSGLRLAGYGAPAKGMTLLAYCGLGPAEVPYLVDRSPHKQGRVTPGHHVPIVGPERLLQDQPDVVLLLAWNFATEVVRQQAEFHRRGGRFLLPLPVARFHDAPEPTQVAA